jgi:hypothetical protein
VFVDTATLYPISMADLVLRLAELGMFELVWSDHLLAANVILSADRRGYPIQDTAPARRRDPDAYLTHLLKRYPDDVIKAVDEMGSSLRTPLSRSDVLQRLEKAGLSRFAAAATTIGHRRVG